MRRGRRDGQLLRDVLVAIERIESWRDGPWPDDLYRAAVLKELAVIGEAVSRLSKHYTERHPEIPWRRVTGLRNKIVHEYWDTAWATVEVILEQSLPELKGVIEPDAAPPAKRVGDDAFISAGRRPALVPPSPSGDNLCGAWMPLARARCVLPRRHRGHHRSRR